MILAHQEIRRYVDEGKITFDPPLEKTQWGEASVDLRLGLVFGRLRKVDNVKIGVSSGLGAIAKSGLWENFTLETSNKFGRPDTWPLKPNEFVLAMTHERVSVPRDLIAMVQGRSTYARVGISIHQTAPWIQPGWNGNITLEIANLGPFEVELTPLIDRPCQLTFFQLSSELPTNLAYGSRPGDSYQGQQQPIPR